MSNQESQNHRLEGTTDRKKKWKHLQGEKDYVFYYQLSQTSWVTDGKSTGPPPLQKEKTKISMDIRNVLSSVKEGFGKATKDSNGEIRA